MKVQHVKDLVSHLLLGTSNSLGSHLQSLGFERGRSVPVKHWEWVSEGPFCSTGTLGVGFRGAILFHWNTGGGGVSEGPFCSTEGRFQRGHSVPLEHCGGVSEGPFCSTEGGFQRGRSVPLEHWGWVSVGRFCSTEGGFQRGCSVPLRVGFRGAVLFHWNTGGWSSKKLKFLKPQYICHIFVGYAVSGGCFIHPVFLCCSLYRPLMCAVLCTGP